MFLRQTQKDRTKKNEDLIRELEISLSKLEVDVDQSLNDLGMTAEELDQFFNMRENFTEEEWEEITRLKNEHESRLEQAKQLSSIKKIKEARDGLPRNANWIYVK